MSFIDDPHFTRSRHTAASNHKPMVRAIGDPATDFTSEFLKDRHALHLAS